jgi:hypothetical protein
MPRSTNLGQSRAHLIPRLRPMQGNASQQAVDQNPPAYTPLTLRPGQAGTITLVITSTAPSGTLVHGFVAIATFNLDSFSSDELIVLP